jgi:hypothetical protein
MAVFEKKIPRKVFLDDTQVLTCIFENAQNIQGHTVSLKWCMEVLNVKRHATGKEASPTTLNISIRSHFLL